MVNIKNPKWNEFGSIDCEIEHPQHGWVHFTACPNDLEEFGRSVYSSALPLIPADAETPHIKTEEQIREEQFIITKNKLMTIVQNHMDSVAQQRNYDNILSLCTYATSLNPVFSAEGQAGVEWRDAVWSYCYAELDRVISGDRAEPSAEDLLLELPQMVWPY